MPSQDSGPLRKRVLLLASTTGYQTRMFVEAAGRIDFDVALATDRCHVLDDPWGDHATPIRFEDPERAAASVAKMEPRPDGIVAVGDRPTPIAALAARKLGIPYNSPDAVNACRNKFTARECFQSAGLPVPRYRRASAYEDARELSREVRYPCVLKPLGLSASRGVIRANQPREFVEAFNRICAILHNPDIIRQHDEQDRYIQLEDFIPGREFALEGILTNGRLQTLAIFEKPDPLDGPYFEETIYLTPPRISGAEQERIVETVQRAAGALELSHGPLHAEMRVNQSGVWMLEVAARPIGGLCARALRFDGGAGLEELILRHSVGEDVSNYQREEKASGVMMIPIPQNGVYQGTEGVESASAVEGITSVSMTAKQGQRLLKLPEGNSYLGFLFASGETSSQVDGALRAAHGELRFDISAELAVVGQPID